MTTQTTRTSKATPAKEIAVPEEIKSELVPDDVVTEEVEKPRIPELLSGNPIFNNFCERYLATLDKIAEYNKEVFAEKDAEWNPTKVIGKAREFASPDDATKVKPEIKKALDAWETAVAEAMKLRKTVLDVTSKELGITLSNTSERNPETEAPLKEERKIAHTIGDQLNTMGSISNDINFNAAVALFLTDNPLPQVGRDQVSTFGESAKATPKYRVKVTVKNKDGEEVVSEDGFTKASHALTKLPAAIAYERGKALKSDDLRTAWEKAGNNAEKTVTPVVEFTDNGLLYTLTKK